MADRKQDTAEGRQGLFDGLSFSQVTAGALAAVTSMLLSREIGIAGSVIGVAAGSVVSAVASQVYRGMLRRSADKLRDLAGSDSVVVEGAGVAGDGANPYVGAAGVTTRMSQVGGRDAGREVSPRLAPEGLRKRALTRRQETLKRRIIVVAVASSLVAVAVTAALVHVATAGHGLGPRVSVVGGGAPVTEEVAGTTGELGSKDNEMSEGTGSKASPAPAKPQAENTAGPQDDAKAPGLGSAPEGSSSPDAPEGDGSKPSEGTSNESNGLGAGSDSASDADKDTQPDAGADDEGAAPQADGNSPTSAS